MKHDKRLLRLIVTECVRAKRAALGSVLGLTEEQEIDGTLELIRAGLVVVKCDGDPTDVDAEFTYWIEPVTAPRRERRRLAREARRAGGCIEQEQN